MENNEKHHPKIKIRMCSHGCYKLIICAIIVSVIIPKNDAHGEILGDVVDGVKDIHDKISDTAENIIDNVQDVHSDITGGMIDKAKDVSENMKDHAEEIHDVLLDPYKEVMEMFKLTKLEDFTEDVLEKVVKKFFGRFHCVSAIQNHARHCQHSLVSNLAMSAYSKTTLT